MKRLLTAVPAVVVAGTVVASATVPAQAALPKPRSYSSCADLNKVYKHGVGLKGAKDKVARGSRAVTNFTVDKKTYDLNARRLDRDRDGIACEKR